MQQAPGGKATGGLLFPDLMGPEPHAKFPTAMTVGRHEHGKALMLLLQARRTFAPDT